MKLCSVVLAAGESRRFGGPKQLAMVRGQTMLNTALEKLIHPLIEQRFVVLGAYGEQIRPSLPADVVIVMNDRWQEGMGYSLACAVKQLPADCSHVLILLADQIEVDESLLDKIIGLQIGQPNRIIATGYSHTIGVPVCFPRALFDTLRDCSGDKGARQWLREHSEQITMVDGPAAAADIDTVDDLADYLAKQDEQEKS